MLQLQEWFTVSEMYNFVSRLQHFTVWIFDTLKDVHMYSQCFTCCFAVSQFSVSHFLRFTVSLLKSLNVLVFHISSVYQLQRFPVAVFHIFSVPRFTFSSSISQFQRDTVSVCASQFQCFIGRWLLHVRRTLLLLRDSSSGSMKRSLVVRQLLVLPVLLRK